MSKGELALIALASEYVGLFSIGINFCRGNELVILIHFRNIGSTWHKGIPIFITLAFTSIVKNVGKILMGIYSHFFTALYQRIIQSTRFCSLRCNTKEEIFPTKSKWPNTIFNKLVTASCPTVVQKARQLLPPLKSIINSSCQRAPLKNYFLLFIQPTLYCIQIGLQNLSFKQILFSLRGFGPLCWSIRSPS